MAEAELVVNGEDPLLNVYKAQCVERPAHYAAGAELSFPA